MDNDILHMNENNMLWQFIIIKMIYSRSSFRNSEFKKLLYKQLFFKAIILKKKIEIQTTIISDLWNKLLGKIGSANSKHACVSAA